MSDADFCTCGHSEHDHLSAFGERPCHRCYCRDFVAAFKPLGAPAAKAGPEPCCCVCHSKAYGDGGPTLKAVHDAAQEAANALASMDPRAELTRRIVASALASLATVNIIPKGTP